MSQLKRSPIGHVRRAIYTGTAPSPESTVDGQQPLLSAQFFRNLVPSYMESVFPTHPIIDQEGLLRSIDCMDADRTAESLVCASIAATLHSTSNDNPEYRPSLRPLIHRSILALGPMQPFAKFSISRAVACLLLANCLVAINDPDTAFLYLRQATSFVELLQSRKDMLADREEDPKLDRFYWLTYVHERYQCISAYHRPTLKPPLDTVLAEGHLPSNLFVGFRRLIKLFCLVDDDFVGYWLGTQTQRPITAEWVNRKCEAFRQDEWEADRESSQLSAAQQADLFVTRNWLLALLWRIAMSNNLLRSLEPSTGFSLLYPLHIANHLRSVMEELPHKAIEIHGVGIGQKLFELADTAADVILHVTTIAEPQSALQLDDFLFLRNMLSKFPYLDDTRKNLIEEKLARASTGAV